MGFGGAAPPSREVGTIPRMGTRLEADGLPAVMVGAHELWGRDCWHRSWDDFCPVLRSDVVRWSM